MRKRSKAETKIIVPLKRHLKTDIHTESSTQLQLNFIKYTHLYPKYIRENSFGLFTSDSIQLLKPPFSAFLYIISIFRFKWDYIKAVSLCHKTLVFWFYSLQKTKQNRKVWATSSVKKELNISVQVKKCFEWCMHRQWDRLMRLEYSDLYDIKKDLTCPRVLNKCTVSKTTCDV